MHAYPENLAALIRQKWPRSVTGDDGLPVVADPLPPDSHVELLLSTCYQASLMREEDRPVRFRLMLRDPDLFEPGAGPPRGLQRLMFGRTVDFDANELRRISPAATYERALVGVQTTDQAHFEIWGIIHSGRTWLQALEGSRRTRGPMPPALVVLANGPGQITAACGHETVASLVSGRVTTPDQANQMLSTLTELEQMEPAADQLLLTMHTRARMAAREPWARLSPLLLPRMRRQLFVRMVSALRQGHGATVLSLPQRLAHRPAALNRFLTIKYAFPVEESRRRLRTLLVRQLNALAADCGRRFGADHEAGWDDFLSSNDPQVVETDDAMGDTIRLLACMAEVDGALVLARPFEVIGFGAEISGRLPQVDYVARPTGGQDPRFILESTQDVGTRHRSAYRFCLAIPKATALVVSRDGSIRVVRKQGEHVFCEDLVGSGLISH